MRHRKSSLRLKQKPHHARMIERNIVTSVLLYEAVRTTRKRAKVIQPIVDRLITVAKKQEPRLAIRAINQFVTDENACHKLLEVFKGRYASRPSGFTTLKPVGSRKGDGAELVDLALVDQDIGHRTSDKGTTRSPKSAVRTSKSKTTA